MKQMNNSLLLSIIIMLLSFSIKSCESDENNSQSEEPPASIGFWKSQASGYVLEVKEDGTINQYGTSSLGCVNTTENLDLINFANLSINQISETELTLSSPLITGEILFTLLTDEEQECATENLISSTDPSINYRHFWTVFNEYYSSFEQRGVDWLVYQDAENQATDDNLYELIKQAIEPLNDGHVSVFNDNIDIPSGSEELFTRLNEFLTPEQQVENFIQLNELFDAKEQTIVSNYIDPTVGVGSDESGNVLYGIAPGNVGYINILSMQDFSDDTRTELEAVDAAMSEIIGAISTFEIEKLIIDIRFNTGGFDGVGLNIASRFFDQERTVFTKASRLGDTFGDEATITVVPHPNENFTGEIIVLTSPLTASAAETFTLAMNTLPHVTIVGQNTQGIFSDILTHRLPNGTFINLSNQVYTDPDGINYEGIGVGPNLENTIPFLSSSDLNNDRDSGIDRALELLEN